MNEQFGIGEAVKALQNGSLVQRAGWNGKGMYLILVTGNSWSPEFLPAPARSARPASFVALKGVDGRLIPWNASQADLLAIDWELASGETA